MNFDSVLAAIEAWPLSAAIRGAGTGTAWLFPIIETLHVIALTLVMGSIAMLDLRLLGITSRTTPVSRLSRELLPCTWIAWCFAALFGTLLFVSKASTYAANLQFQLKLAFMGLAAINMVVFHFGVYRRVSSWDLANPPLSAKAAGAFSLALWIGVVFLGRWIGFTT